MHVFQGNRRRHQKTRCDGARPCCRSCAGSGQNCFYVADADATPMTVQKRRNEALQQLCTEQLSFLEALISVSEVDAPMLLGRFRGGEKIPSLLVAATHMPKMHKIQGLFASSQIQKPSSWSPVATESGRLRNGSPVSLDASASSSLPVLEPKVNMTLMPQDPFRHWYVSMYAQCSSFKSLKERLPTRATVLGERF